ncbi:putative intron-binding protein aquarius-like [Capsicum annuum]|nr:putative intron-binding protein aquarius-like [Capsicum annuum]
MGLIPHSQVFSPFPGINNSSTNQFPKITRTLKFSASSDEQISVETDPVKLAFAKAKAYKKETKSPDPSPKIVQNGAKDSDDQVVPPADKIALDSNTIQQRGHGFKPWKQPLAEMQGSNKENGENDFIKKENGKSDRNALPKESGRKKEKLTISSIDFVGLGFSDNKKSRGLPAGLVPIVDPFSGGALPDVEILVGDTSKFADTETSKSNRIQEDDMNTYKPKVSTWGVFPRPNDISKTFGGGRTIRPGEVLESAEEKAAKAARTRELLAAYKKRVGLTIDPNLKLEYGLKSKVSKLGNCNMAMALDEWDKFKLPSDVKLESFRDIGLQSSLNLSTPSDL